jgi:hypothetical protein
MAFLRGVFPLLVTANVPSSLIIFTLMIKTIRSSETSVLKTATWRLHIPEDIILHSHIYFNVTIRKEIHKYLSFLSFWFKKKVFITTLYISN